MDKEAMKNYYFSISIRANDKKRKEYQAQSSLE
jgi:hypothetical protein